jgi:hypothetical protein
MSNLSVRAELVEAPRATLAQALRQAQGERVGEVDRLSLAAYDPRDPDPWLALMLDRTLPIAQDAKALLLRDASTRSRQFLLPLVRPFARAMIVVAQLIHTVGPRWFHMPRLLHRMIAWGMNRLLTPEASVLILRHFHLGSQILRFIADNATPGFRPTLEPMAPRVPDDVRDNLFLKHDLNIYNFLIQLNAELDARGDAVTRKHRLDFSAISAVEIAPPKRGRCNLVDLATAIEVYTPAYALLLSDRDFWRAANSLQLDETIGLYAARLTGEEQHLALVNNRHPLVPMSTLRAGFRLMLHGLSTEVLHGMLLQMKQRQPLTH